MRDNVTDLAVVLAGIGAGLWLQDVVAGLTGASGIKLLFGQAVIWSAVIGVSVSWLARRRLAALARRLSVQLEARQATPLARRARAGRGERAAGVLFALGGAALTALALVDATTFTGLFVEDGPFEYGSALLYLFAAWACLLLAVRARGGGRGRLALWLVGLAAMFVFVGGEEISWGQRIVGFGTPDALAAVNVQGEFTLHNVWSNSLFVYPGLAVTAVLLFVLPLVHRHVPTMRRLLDALEFPVAPPLAAGLYAFAVACYAVTGLALGTPTPLPINWSDHLPHYDDELLEFLIAALFAIQAGSLWRIALPGGEAEVRQGQGGLAAE
ncbi:hypothetical protein SAMN04515621_2920 [Erythrobacter sp. HL-111]|nr:MAG: Protein of unknown function (DUF998) [Erythrobacteraceae bacterium HL-111]SDT10530.1 hypothetical protein SAMN04515621_2920 [Erythrobacter sp. HL-111]